MRSIVFTLIPLFLLAGYSGVAASKDPNRFHELTELPERPMAPDLTLPDTDGKVHRLSDYRGKPVIVNFWATWCRPCRKEMPSLQRAWEQVREQGVMLLAVSMGDREQWIPKFRASFDMEFDFPILLDTKSTFSALWSVRELPVTYIVDTEGRLVYRAPGEREWDSPIMLEKVLALRNE